MGSKQPVSYPCHIECKELNIDNSRKLSFSAIVKRQWKNAIVALAGLVLAANIMSFFFDVSVSVRPRGVVSEIVGAQQGEGQSANAASQSFNDLSERVIPSSGMTIPVKWGNLGKQLLETGVIDEQKFLALYADRGGISQDMSDLLYQDEVGSITMTTENSSVLLNILWALGLGSKNSILENGPMQNPEYGGAGGFASTGGWTVAKGDAMDHYSKHQFFSLTPEQQELVERVSKGIYRPCCGNSVHFPDCNHGMAMLGLLELMASQGISEEQMYTIALQVNAYWFPDTYLTIANYLEKRGIPWASAEPKEILGEGFSSSAGYRRILSEEQPVQSKNSGGGCGV
ncbi:hypothetical protein HYV71_01930 [Candidatus Uhrbacteria bacterium]|nr:hypothetical protein [Candidatus Uhrbacteria bacterium]